MNNLSVLVYVNIFQCFKDKNGLLLHQMSWVVMALCYNKLKITPFIANTPLSEHVNIFFFFYISTQDFV